MLQNLTLLPAPRRLFLHGSRCSAVPSSAAVHIDPRLAPQPQGYRLTIAPRRIDIVAHDDAGAFYGKQTLSQIASASSASAASGHETGLPCLAIDDHPDFPFRGFMLDISRDKVPTMATLYALVDLLAALKVNQFQLYTEHTFAYRGHQTVWEQASPITADEIRALDAYCRERFIELVPNQNSFGHMHRWLKHDRYRPLAETPEGCPIPWMPKDEPFSLCPLDPGSLGLVGELFSELLPLFSSRQVNVGCDETFDLGMGRCKDECASRGKGRVYLDFLLRIHGLLQPHHRTMQFWGDIILHHPELIAELPGDIIALEWGYEVNHPFADHARQFAAAGVPFYVCPGTSSWLSISGRTANAIANLRLAAEQGLAHGAIGYLNTDWGDCGHWQQLPISYPGLAYGAAVSWCCATNSGLDLPAALDAHVFHDPAGVLGRAAVGLGEAYLKTGVLMGNRTVFAELTQINPDASLKEGPLAWLTGAGLRAAEGHVEQAEAPLGAARSARPDAALLAAELRQTAALVRHACTLGQARLATDGALIPALPATTRTALADELEPLLAEHRRLWLARNRPGGLPDSAARMERLIRLYRS